MNKINEADLKRLRRIARDAILEPFEGRKSLERLQKTKNKIEKNISDLKNAGIKAGRWVSATKLAKFSKSKFQKIVKETKGSSSSQRVSKMIEKFEHSVSELQETAKIKYKDIEEKTLKVVIAYIEKGIETLMLENTEEWVVKRAAKTLNRPDLNSMEEIRGLEAIDRDILMAELYHYDDPSLKKMAKSFDTGINVALGAVVASNLPGTGLIVSLINMGKTIVKMSGRLNTMSAVYGYRIESPEALFKVSAMILRSLEDWENNYEHVPISPRILDILYQPSEDDAQSSFQELANAIVKKEAYIAIPGVGMISLGKITLDDLKIDLVIKHMVQNYFDEKELLEKLSSEQAQLILNDFKIIYSAFLKFDYFKTARKQQEKERLSEDQNKFKNRLKLLAGIDLTLEKSSGDLDHFAKKIFHTIHNLPEEDKEKAINEEIRIICESFS